MNGKFEVENAYCVDVAEEISAEDAKAWIQKYLNQNASNLMKGNMSLMVDGEELIVSEEDLSKMLMSHNINDVKAFIEEELKED